MKNFLMISPHSTVDIITNSSSELFVCDTEKSKELVEEFLHKLLDFYNTDEKTKMKFKKVFGDIYVLNEENIDEFIDRFVLGWGFISYRWHDVENVPSSSDTYNKYKFKYPYSSPENKEYNKKMEELREKEEEEAKNAWLKNNGEKVKNYLLGKICVFSAEDNSIPYDLFELIEGKLGAQRVHLG